MILFTPKNIENPYQSRIIQNCRELGASIGFFDFDITRSQTLNLLMAFPRLVFYRLTGMKVLHLHWLYGFVVPFSPRLGRLGLNSFVALAGILGLKIVYTWHNILPHRTLFDNDHRAMEQISRKFDAVVALSPQAKQQICKEFSIPASIVTVVEEPGHLLPAASGRTESRAHFGIQDQRIFGVFGHLDYYKGVDTVATALNNLSTSDVKFGFCGIGTVESSAIRDDLLACQRLIERNGHYFFLKEEYVTDEELSMYLEAIDVVVLPFRRITNSTTLLTAARAGKVVIIPNHESLEYVPFNAALRFSNEHELQLQLQRCLDDWIPVQEYGHEARRWVAQRTSDTEAQAMRDVYRKLIHKMP
jgi:glycosyltransferase involved in cell wall biosynthesis